MTNRLQDILWRFVSRFGIKNTRKAFAMFLLALSIVFLQFAELPTIIDWIKYLTNFVDIKTPVALTLKSILWTVIGLATFITGCSFFLYELFGYSEHKKRIDTAILRDWDLLIDPNDLNDFLTQRLGTNHSIFEYQSLWLTEWVQFLDKQRNKLKNKKMRRVQHELLVNLENLKQFTFYNFSSVSANLIRLAPHLQIHSGDYQSLVTKLNSNIENCLRSNRRLRDLINRKLPEYNDRVIN